MLLGKRYTELDPTIAVQANSLLAAYNIGDPELSKITFEDFQKNIGLKNLNDFSGEIISNGSFAKYNSSLGKFAAGLLVADDIPTLPISKISTLTNTLTNKEPSFQKGTVKSTTISITNGVGRLVGSEDLILEVNLAGIPDVVPQSRTIRLFSSDEGVTFNNVFDITYTLENNLAIDIKTNNLNLEKVTGFGNATTNKIVITNVEGLVVNPGTGLTGTNMFTLQNSEGGGVFVQGRGSTTIKAKGASLTNYFILRLQNESDTTVFEVRSNGATKGGPAGNSDEFTTLSQLNTTFNSLTGTDGVQRIVNEFSVDSTVLRSNDVNQVKNGLIAFRTGSNLGETLNDSWEYPDNDGEDYNLRLYNNGSGNNVRWVFKQTFSLSTGSVNQTLQYPMLGFRNGILLVGTDVYPSELGIETHYNNQVEPFERFPLSLYSSGQALFTGRVYVGKENYDNTLFLQESDTLYSEGRGYFKEGIRTKLAQDSSLDGPTWILGDVIAYDSDPTPTGYAYLRINGTLYKVFIKT